jgi:hypothetical protein
MNSHRENDSWPKNPGAVVKEPGAETGEQDGAKVLGAMTESCQTRAGDHGQRPAEA